MAIDDKFFSSGNPDDPFQGPELPEMESSEEPSLEETNPRLAAALDSRRKQRLMSDLLAGFQQIIGASSGTKPDMTMSERIAQRAEDPMKRYKLDKAEDAAAKKEKRESEAHEMKMDEFQTKLMTSKLDFQDLEANSKPDSPQSKMAQDRVIAKQKELGQPVNEDSVRQQSAKDLYKTFKYLQDDLTQHYKNYNAEADRTSREGIADKRLESSERIAKTAEEGRQAERERREKTEERLQKNQEARRKQEDIKNRQQQINTARGLIKDDPRFKKAVEQGMEFEAVSELITEAEAGNEAAVAALGTKLARAMGEVGVLTDTDVVRYTNGTSWGRKLKEWYNKGMKGEFSKDMIKDISRNMKVLSKKLGGDVNRVYDNAAARMKASYPQEQYPHMDDKTIRGILGAPIGGEFGKSAAEKKQSEASSSEIRRQTKDGRIAVFDQNKKFLRYEE